MTTVSLKEAKNRLPELARKVESGETVTITRNGLPVVDMVPSKFAGTDVATAMPTGGLDWAAIAAYKRSHGIGKVFSYIAPDFDDPLPEDFLITPERD